MTADGRLDWPGLLDTQELHNEAASKASGLTPPRWLCLRFRLDNTSM